MIARLYSRTGEDISKSFPDLLDALRLPGAIDGELLIMREHRVQSFNVLQQRLNRKTVTPKLLAEFPAHLRAYDLLADGDEDLRERPFAERRTRLEEFVARLNEERVDLSPLVSFSTWDELIAARSDPASAGAGADAAAVEGVMLKRRDALYLPGRPKGPWWKWKRDPFIIDAVLMYAQRGHGKRSSFYSDYTFGVWTKGEAGDELVPVGKAYFGFTDEELLQIDRFVRRNTTDKFGPVREVVHEPDQGLVLEVAFEGLQRSTRHKSGLAMRFPRISRLRWDKPPGEADRLDRLEAMVARIEEITASSGPKLGTGIHPAGIRFPLSRQSGMTEVASTRRHLLPRPLGHLFERPARPRRDRQRIGEAERQPLGAGPGDHRAVVGAQSRRRRHQFGADLEGDAVQDLADRLVGRDAAGADQRLGRIDPQAEHAQPRAQPVLHDIDDGLLERGAEIGDILVAERRDFFRLDAQRGLQARQRKVRVAAAVHRARQSKALRIAARRLLLHQRAAGIAEPEQFRGLVERLADGVVDRAAEPDIVADAAHREDLGVAAGGQKQAIGKIDAVGEPRGRAHGPRDD